MKTPFSIPGCIPALSLILISFMNNGSALAQDTSHLKTPEFDRQGHRGSRGLMPENTIPAMLKAMDLGVTTLEMDVCFTADNKAVLSHEPFFSHIITLKPGGEPVLKSEAHGLNLFKMKYDEVKLYDVGSRIHPAFPRQQKFKVSKPLLCDVIDSCELYAIERNLPLPLYNIETKTSPLTDSIYHPAPAPFVDMMMSVVVDAGIINRTTIQSFDIRTLQHLREKFPSVSTALLVEKNEHVNEKLKQLGFIPDILSPEYTMVSNELISYCHEHKMKVIPWTVNEADTIKKLRMMGVDGIITDYPDLFEDAK